MAESEIDRPTSDIESSQKAQNHDGRKSQKAKNKHDRMKPSTSQEAQTSDHENKKHYSQDSDDTLEERGRSRYRIPRKRKRYRSRSSSRSSTSSCDSDCSKDTNDSSSDSDTSDSDARYHQRKRDHFKSRALTRDSSQDGDNNNGGAQYERFAPREIDLRPSLSDGMNSYIDQNFTEYLKESVIEDSILKSCPVPNNRECETKTLDDEWADMLEEKQNAGTKAQDSAFRRIHQRVVNIMGPLSKVWSTVESARENGDEADLDMFEFLSAIEQTVCLVGQAGVAVNYHRRLNILSRFFKNQKKAQKCLAKHKHLLLKGRTLFGSKFYRKLSKQSKDKKKRKLLQRELSDNKKFTRPPFQGEPTHTSVLDRVGFQSRSYGGYQGSRNTLRLRHRGGRGGSRGRGSLNTEGSTRKNS